MNAYGILKIPVPSDAFSKWANVSLLLRIEEFEEKKN